MDSDRDADDAQSEEHLETLLVAPGAEEDDHHTEEELAQHHDGLVGVGLLGVLLVQEPVPRKEGRFDQVVPV